MTERSNIKLNPLKYFYMSLLLPNRILNHKKVVSKWASILVSTLPVVLFLVLALAPFYAVFETVFGDGNLIIQAGLILLVYLWVFYAAGFLVFYFMNKNALKQPKSTGKLLHDYGVLALMTQFILILFAALILVIITTAADITIAFVITIPSIVLIMFIYITFAIFIFGKYLIEDQNAQVVKWIVMFIIFHLLTAFIFTILPFIILRIS
ncbi:hypothetical protein [Lacicoccus qingdaonensis]|uniref:Yip1 domain-containing protein n=1 Tax=Lacicoccus qingdaonensis TaxID=576118 RepID=A0A1G9GXE9_9BACL|nr:hypothetical protein [Salinicoccus qingdaonensis]SDL05264.1 hypothetical protein SAMN05216216_11944 [Salinicoccus qingdaonensis]